MTVNIGSNGFVEKITASGEVLNMISMFLDAAERAYKTEDCDGLASEARRMSDTIYDALCNKGFYKKEEI